MYGPSVGVQQPSTRDQVRAVAEVARAVGASMVISWLEVAEAGAARSFARFDGQEAVPPSASAASWITRNTAAKYPP
jgi:hypothetical protein